MKKLITLLIIISFSVYGLAKDNVKAQVSEGTVYILDTETLTFSIQAENKDRRPVSIEISSFDIYRDNLVFNEQLKDTLLISLKPGEFQNTYFSFVIGKYPVLGCDKILIHYRKTGSHTTRTLKIKKINILQHPFPCKSSPGNPRDATGFNKLPLVLSW